MKIPQFVLSLLPMNTAVNLNMFVTKLIEAIMLRMFSHCCPNKHNNAKKPTIHGVKQVSKSD